MSDKILCQEPVLVEFTEEEKRIHHLLLTANFLADLGICDGKMKVAIYFFGLYRRGGNRFYEEFAFELLDEICEAVNERTPVGFEHGICGIGWGMEYLIRERFLAVDEDVCEKWDGYVLSCFQRGAYQNIGLSAGLCGMLFYLLCRIESSRVTPGGKTMNQNKALACRVLGQIDEALTEEKTEELLRAGCKEDYHPGMPFFYSGWDYPALLWCTGRISVYHPCSVIAAKLLEKLTRPLPEKSHWPDSLQEKRLLVSALAGIPAECDEIVRQRVGVVRQNMKGEDEFSRYDWADIHFSNDSKKRL